MLPILYLIVVLVYSVKYFDQRVWEEGTGWSAFFDFCHGLFLLPFWCHWFAMVCVCGSSRASSTSFLKIGLFQMIQI